VPRHLRAGREAERIAQRFLQRNGLRTVAENYSCRSGELDLVMLEGREIVFVEIRYRRSVRLMTPAETVDLGKRRRLARAALHFLQRHADYGDNPVRFDVIGMSGSLADPFIDWLRNAFSTQDL
jgi:putative endonuclease